MAKFTAFAADRQRQREAARRKFRIGSVALLLSVVTLIGSITTIMVFHAKFMIECGGHLERASNATNIELATQELDIAVRYLERHNLTSGYTSVLWNTPEDDLGFVYQNIRSANDQLKAMPDSISNLEESNMLIKLRETLTDKDGLALPNGISRYPYNLAFGLALWVSVVVLVIGIPYTIYQADEM